MRSSRSGWDLAEWWEHLTANAEVVTSAVLLIRGSGFDLSPWCGSVYGFWFDADPDRDPTFHPDADPDPDPDSSFQIKAQNLEKALKQPHIPYILACHLQIDADPDPVPAYHFDEDPDADPDPDFYLMRIRMRIRIFIGCGCGSRLPKWCGSGCRSGSTNWSQLPGFDPSILRHSGILRGGRWSSVERSTEKII